MVVLGRVSGLQDFHRFLSELDVKGKVFLVKPNWSNAHTYTSAETLDWLFSVLKGKVKVIEGYSPWRNEVNTGQERREVMTSSNAKAKWQWIREQDKWFLEYSGIDKVLAKYGVDYINVTEEFWSIRTLDPEEVREYVDPKYGVLVSKEMYSFMPAKIHELRGSTFISFNNSHRIRGHISLSTENLFGLIPNPARSEEWHGKSDRRLSQSVVDINKVYRSFLSPCYWINEVKDLGVFAGGKNSVEVDAVTAKLMGVDPGEIGYLRYAAKVFGGYDEKVLSRIPELL